MQKDDFTVKQFPGLDRFHTDRKPARPLRVCIATEEIFGPVRNGGIASTYYHLARTLAADGHQVTVLYLKGEGQCENLTLEHWMGFYAGLGVRFVPLPAEGGPKAGPALFWQERYYSFYRWLREQEPFDIVHTSEWRGGAYYALLARRQGLAFGNTLFLVKSSSPWIWNRHYTMRTVESPRQLACMHAERRTLEMGDVVIGGSAHLLTFMETKGYRLPAGRTFVQPNIIDLQDLGIEEKRPAYGYGEKVRSSELVFFGRLEGRKGLEIFCDALNRLLEEGIQPERVTFLGKKVRSLPSYPQLTSHEYIEQQARHWPFPAQIIDSYDQDKAIGYLCSEPRIAVMPSIIENSTMAVYEALVHRIPFIATRTGGTPELIDPEFHDAVLTDAHPEALAGALRRVLSEGATVARGAFDYEQNLAVWRAFHNYLAVRFAETDAAAIRAELAEIGAGSAGDGAAAASAAGQRPGPLPKVSACIYYHHRPRFLEALADSLLTLDEMPDEVIVVVDGAPQSAAEREALNVTEQRLAPLKPRFITQPHRCMGAAWNAAAAAATGDLLLFLHAERHLAKPPLVAALKRAAASSPAAAFTFVYDRFDAAMRPPADSAGTRVLPMGGDLASGFYLEGAFGGSCFAVRRDRFMESGGLSDSYHLPGVEQELFAQLQLEGNDLEVIPECLCWERAVQPNVAFNAFSGDYLAIRPFLKRSPHYLEAVLLLAREQARLQAAAENELINLRKSRKELQLENERLRAALEGSAAGQDIDDLHAVSLQAEAQRTSAPAEPAAPAGGTAVESVAIPANAPAKRGNRGNGKAGPQLVARVKKAVAPLMPGPLRRSLRRFLQTR